MVDLVIFRWWVTIFLAGIIFLPLTVKLFSSFFDKGYIFSKIIGIAIISYTVFILGIFHIAPFTFITILSVGFIFFLLNYFLFRKSLIKILTKRWLIFLIEELIFILSLLLWSFVKSYQPDIHGLEKYMDFGFVNSILRSDYFPPADMWFTPFPINYYYFGHLATAVLTKLSNISSNITYNLMLSSIFAFTFAASFSIGGNLVYKLKNQNSKVKNIVQNFKIILSGLLTAFLVSFAGNLQVIYSFFKPYQNENPLPFWQLPLSLESFPNSYWYPNATRFIYNTIHEFPIYSFVVSDLHGHVLDIPFVLLIIALLLSLITKSQISNHKSQINNNAQNSKRSKIWNLKNWNLFGAWNLRFGNLLLISFLLAVMYMTNVWDGIIYFMLTVLVLFLPVASAIKNSKNDKFTFLKFTFYIASIGILFLIFSAPFNLNFKPFASGIGILCPPEFLIEKGKIGPFLFEQNTCQRSPLWQLMLLYGFFYFWVVTFLLTFVKRKNPKSEISNPKQTQNHKDQNYKRFEFLNFRNWNLFRTWNFEFGILNPSDIFVILLILLSTLLIIIPEFIYIKDIYPAHYRANTMFKLVYQSFIMLSISSGYIIVRLILGLKLHFSNLKSYLRLSVFLIGGMLLILVFLYPQFAIGSYYNNFQTKSGIDGTKYLKSLYPTDYEAINWINKKIKNQPVMLEAQGDSYTDFARISANTGLPTVLGWTVHEWLWRGTYDIPAPRITEVKTIYETPDINVAKKLINKYKILYIFIGNLEYQQYPSLNESKFKILGTLVYQNGSTKIYKIN
ncbi:MAG: hypothetical protein HYT08_02800 [Candidatus Levybacteria bacterium]|nr:hypothetical protein [Candidatus Levybacteria bacterium]